MKMDPSILNLYVIPDRSIGAPRSLAEQASLALDGGATAIQLRDKAMSSSEMTKIARSFTGLCHNKGAKFFVNDRLEVALTAEADGCHLGQSDYPLSKARKMAPRPFLIGLSVHTPEQARIAEEEGADYIGVGAIFPTGTKNDASVIGLEGLREIARSTTLPIVAIGGIALANVPSVMEAGASGIAVVSAVVGTSDPTNSARELLKLVRP